MAIEDNQELIVEFTEGRTVAEFVANGAFGGSSPLGEVVVWFYFERGKAPAGRRECYRAAGGRFEQQSVDHGGADLVREIVARAVLTPRSAITIGEWLAAQGREAMERARIIEEAAKSLEEAE
jgi:hypothetical protein